MLANEVKDDLRCGPDSAPSTRRSARSAIILAGGEGHRMRPLIQKWLGEDRPKQYCTYVGSRSMLQHALDRAGAIATPEHITTVVCQGHQAHLRKAIPAGLPGLVLEQPFNRGTAPSIFLAASYIMEANPQATVLILPSDLFVHPEERFNQYTEQACQMAEAHEDQLILLGAAPDRPETDYGWIEVWNNGETFEDENGAQRPIPVRGFHEKPNRMRAESLLLHGSLWNTMVVAVKVKALWALGWALLPDLMEQFESLRQVLRAIRLDWVRREHAQVATSHIYHKIEMLDFSRDFLQHAANWTGVLRMEGLEWSDWGRPERVMETLNQIGRTPAFPVSSLPFEQAPTSGLRDLIRAGRGEALGLR
jgi:mannose-1-phosphate guanylyltransferase